MRPIPASSTASATSYAPPFSSDLASVNNRIRRMLRLTGVLVILATPSAAVGQEASERQEEGFAVRMGAAELFAFADAARDRGEYAIAESAYRALSTNPREELRAEARFRLAMMLHDKLGRTREAAVLLRQILDDKPDASRVRIELARMQAALGNTRAAERELRAAQVSDLPPEVERLVQFYASSLNAQHPYGFSMEVALAPDSNINRATKSDTLGTIIGDFDLSEDAREQSGIGLSTRAQIWGRLPVTPELDLRAEVNGSGNFYRHGEFDDYALGGEAGPLWRSGRDTLAVSAIVQWRWFGHDPYTFTYGAEASFRHPAGRSSQLRIDIAALQSDDHINDLRDADRYSLSLGLDRAFSSRFGGGARVTGQRSVARDPGYSTTSGGVSAYVFREFGGLTLVGTAGYSHLQADRRIFLYPQARSDDRLNLGISSTHRWLRVGTFAPIVGISFERNWSSVEIYDYRRLAAKAGITAAF